MKILVLLLLALIIVFTSNAQTEVKKEYYGNGKIKSETTYVDGKANGIKKEYYESGELEIESTKLNGKTNGIFKWFFKNGNLKCEAYYVNDLRNGVQKYYDIRGNIESEANFVDGKMVSSNIPEATKLVTKNAVSDNNVIVAEPAVVVKPLAQPKTQEVVTPIHNDAKPVTKTSVANNNVAVSTPIINKNNGCVSGDCMNGYGTYNDALGSVYVGDFKNGKYQGKGILTQYDGKIFNGWWKDGEWFVKGCLSGDCKDGYGTSIDEQGIYTGKFEYGSRVDGEIIWAAEPNGYYKKCKFKDYKFKDYKYFTSANVEISKKEYEKKHEQKPYIHEVYPKCISGDCQNGYGTILYQNGDRYFGYTVNGKREGLGFVWASDIVSKYTVSYSPFKQITVTKLVLLTFGIWENDVKTKSFDKKGFYEILENNPYYGLIWKGLAERRVAEDIESAKDAKDAQSYAETIYYYDRMKNTSFSSGSSSGSSNASSGNGTGSTKMPDIVYKTVGGSSTIIYTHKQ